MTKQKAKHLKEKAIKSLEVFLNQQIEANPSKSSKISYWVMDYIDFLSKEHNFDYSKLKRYKRGDIIKVHLGFRIGSEEGGLHYCVVLDKNNSKLSPNITVIPLTSVKPGKDTSKPLAGSIYLGDEIYKKITEKIAILKKDILDTASEVVTEIMPKDKDWGSDSEIEAQLALLAEILKQRLQGKLNYMQKMLDEVKKLKQGSIAHINQITTVSKLRIYDPKTSYDVLHKIRLSDSSLDLIDEKLKEMYIK